MPILTGCAASPGKPARTGVQIPKDCEDLAERVPAPRFTKGQSPKLGTALALGALDRANGNLDATRSCQQRQRARFARGA